MLVDGDLVLTESVAIVLYLAQKYPEKRFGPTDLGERAQLNRQPERIAANSRRGELTAKGTRA